MGIRLDEKLMYMWLGHMTTFRTEDVTNLLEIFGGIENTFRHMYKNSSELEKLCNSGVIKKTTMEEILSTDLESWYQELAYKMENSGIRVVTPVCPDYPERLLELKDIPPVIYYRGDIGIAASKHQLGIIGSRRPTHYGMSMADEFASQLANKGIVIISGLAMGIDSRGHRSAVRAEGKTIGVMGGGVDICYPRTNIDIFREMCENQLVLSEYEPGTAHQVIHFPARNRIISGLSDALLVVEAAIRSGTMITVDYALEQGKAIYAIPGRATDIMSKGTNAIIKQGAMLADSPSDIIVDMIGVLKDGEKRRSLYDGKDSTALNEKQKKLMGMLGYEPVFIDDLIRANNMDISDTIHQLNELAKLGFVKCLEQGYYIIK